jgi:hypothetical protein
MGRAQQGSVNTEAKNLFGTETGNAKTAENLLMPSYQNELAHPGLSDAQKAAQINATTGGVGAAFGSEAEGASNRAARTNNAAGLTANQDALARQRMVTSGNLAAQNEAGFTAAERADRDKAQGGIGSLFSQNLQGANATLGHQAANAQTPGFWDTFGNAFAGALGKGLVPGANVGGVSFG